MSALLIRPEDTVISTLGPAAQPSPMRARGWGKQEASFVNEAARVRYQVEEGTGHDRPGDVSFEKAGARERVFFRSEEARAAIVTCGGVSPGLNNVIRSIVIELWHNYDVQDVLGIRYGYQGLNPVVGRPPMRLTPEMVEEIDDMGGTMIGSSRGMQEPRLMADYLKRERINLLFCVGGEGTQLGALELYNECAQRKLPIAIVGIPKTIDNDLPFVSETFGFQTAIQASNSVLEGAHCEARSAPNGIGLVKLMGRYAGFIACGATLASQQVNFCLIPEVPFALEGPNGFYEVLRKRLLAREHAVIVVAEGAGQDLMAAGGESRDASGHPRLKDIGLFLKEKIIAHFNDIEMPVEIKYFDPSYILRSVPANCADSVLSDQMARHAVHAGMAGKSGLLIGHTNNVFIHVPLALAGKHQKRVWPHGELWRNVLSSTGQPPVIR